MSKRTKESHDSTASPSSSSNLLSRLDKDDLKLIKVAIRRHNIPETSDPQPIQRSLDDPFSLCVHRKGEGQHPIFQREGIVVNIEEHLEERIVLKSPGHGEPRRSRSKSTESSRSRSRSEKLDSFKDEDGAAKGDDKRRTVEKRENLYERKYSRDKYDRAWSPKDYRRESQKYDRSSSPYSGQRKHSPPLRLGEYRPPKHTRHQKDPSPLPGPSKLSSRKYSKSPSHRHSKSPDAAQRERTERERSPHRRRSNYRRYSRTPPPLGSRRHNSRSISPHNRRKSRSPLRKYKKTPERGDSYRYSPSKRDSPRRVSRYRSPRRDADDYRSSPERRNDRSKRSPRSSAYRHSRNRSRSPDARESYRGMHREYPTYYDGGEEYWFPSPLPHPGFIPRGFVPPMVRGVPRTMLPFAFGHPMFRPRPPLIYNQPYRPRIFPSTTTTLTTATTTCTVTSAQSTCTPSSSAETAVTTTTASDSRTNVIIEEIHESVSENSGDTPKENTNKQ